MSALFTYKVLELLVGIIAYVPGSVVKERRKGEIF